MSQNAYIDIQFKGDGFSPVKLKALTKFPLEILVESGEVGFFFGIRDEVQFKLTFICGHFNEDLKFLQRGNLQLQVKVVQKMRAIDAMSTMGLL